ncbi:hypothetical protein HPB51_019445 [Rhipicephalus microplus]|uniref:Uncharacterized protein n=1 Tax=Rhipicephalus microplus TaxID=6941 RepID=A0A9J6DPY0_RHIMP|nr:hypothetical protein HPB51_019445 [Rhipicephalus microplus]
MDDETSDVSENDEEEFGWQVAASRRSRAKKKSSTAANAMPCNPQAPSGDTATGGGRIAANATAFKNRVVKASRMPQLPEEHHKIIIRPEGGLNLSQMNTTAIGTAVIEASGLMAKQANECPKFAQNVVVSTPKPDNAAWYARNKSFKIVRVDIRHTQSTITRNTEHELKPLALAANCIKTSGSVIVLFDGLRVPKFVRYRPTLGTRPVAIGHEGAHEDAKPTQEPQKPLTLSELLEIQTPLATQEERPLQVERIAGELRIRSAWCHAGCWDHLG